MILSSPLSKTVILCAALAAAMLLVSGPALAINVCGDGICQGTGIPPETPQNCQADCGFCGDAICGYPENCSACLNDCKGLCLGFTLASELKKSACSGDDDNDCLDNVKENDLAWIVSPWYFYDEDEDCSGAWYTDGPNALHYGRRDFFQVRPSGAAVSQWAPGPSVKTVQISYFLLHPHDCQSHFGFGGHQGDSEHIRYRLRSQDLRTWYLVSGEYNHHGRVHTFSGEYLRARASELGTIYPSVAGDEDGHGSWPGERGSSSACAGSEDDFCTFGTCDCFRGTMKGAFDAGYRDYPSATRNIGGPVPVELWRPSVVTVAGSEAYSVLDVGHGSIVEFWTPRTDGWKKFCGWECNTRFVDSGECAFAVHGETGCSSPLSEKVDTTSFSKSLTANAQPAANDSRGAVPVPRDVEAEAVRLREGIAAAVHAVAAFTPGKAEVFQRRLAGAADPVAALVPMLAGRTREEQAEALAWMLEVGRDKLAATLAPDILAPGRLAPAEREAAAAEVLRVAASLLEAEGYTAPEAARENVER